MKTLRDVAVGQSATIVRLQALADKNIRRYQLLDKEANR